MKALMKVLIVLFVAAVGYGVVMVWTQSRITGDDARTLVAERGAVLVDVRTPEEYAHGHLPGAVNFPLGELKQKAAGIGRRETPVVLYCQSGARSAVAVRTLKRAGFREVYNLGAMRAW